MFLSKLCLFDIIAMLHDCIYPTLLTVQVFLITSTLLFIQSFLASQVFIFGTLSSRTFKKVNLVLYFASKCLYFVIYMPVRQQASSDLSIVYDFNPVHGLEL